MTIGADDLVEDIIATMIRHKVRRLPVIDSDALVGMVSLPDLARSLSNPDVGSKPVQDRR